MKYLENTLIKRGKTKMLEQINIQKQDTIFDFFEQRSLLQQEKIILNESPEWKSLPKNMNNKLHTICSYMAMFPPSLPYYFINKYSKVGDIVLDPFSGRGTTILEACLLNRLGIGNDLNPLAFTLTKAKSNVPLKSSVFRRIYFLEKKFEKTKSLYICLL